MFSRRSILPNEPSHRLPDEKWPSQVIKASGLLTSKYLAFSFGLSKRHVMTPSFHPNWFNRDQCAAFNVPKSLDYISVIASLGSSLILKLVQDFKPRPDQHCRCEIIAISHKSMT